MSVTCSVYLCRGRLHRHAETSPRLRRRTEDPKLPYACAAAGLWPAPRESGNCKYKQPMIECCLYLQFPDSLTREASGVGRHMTLPAGPEAPAGASLFECFESSNLRRRPSARDSVIANTREHITTRVSSSFLRFFVPSG